MNHLFLSAKGKGVKKTVNYVYIFK